MTGSDSQRPDDESTCAGEAQAGLRTEAERLAADAEDRAEAAHVLREMAFLRTEDPDSGRP